MASMSNAIQPDERKNSMETGQKKGAPLTNVEVVTIALYQLGGIARSVDTEDIAVLAHKLAPARFSWRKYVEQINLQGVRFALEDAKKTQFGYVFGDSNEGWILTEPGVNYAKRNAKRLLSENQVKERGSLADKKWRRRERERIISSDAFLKSRENGLEAVSMQEANSLFRIDEYVTGNARERKIARLVNVFRNDPEIGHVIVELAARLRMGGEK